MLEFDVTKSPGLGAYFAGQKQADTLQNSAVARMLQQAQAKNMQERLRMDQAEHPLKLKRMGLENTGLDLGNQQTQGKITDAEIERRRKATDAFFEYIDKNPDDPEGAFVYSGVPRQGKFQQFAQASPEERNQVIQRWRENKFAGEKMKMGEQSRLRREEQAANNADVMRREEMKKKADLDRALQVATINARSRAEAAAKSASGPNTDKRVVALIEQLNAQLRIAESSQDTTQKEAALLEMTRIQRELDMLVQNQQQLEILKQQAAAAGRGAQAGAMGIPAPQMPAATGAPGVPGIPVQQVQPQQGRSITYQGKQYEVVGTNPDGSLKIKDPQTGRTGTLRQ